MTAAPVLLRDVRNEARRPANYWLRLLAASVMIVFFWGLVSRDEQNAHELGARLFPYLHGILLATIGLVTPLLTADCLAREKRDGTMALLLLTRLTPCAVVTAKLLVHFLRGLTMVLAALPLLCLPFLTGGVSLEETLLSAALCGAVLGLGLASGILASACCESWARAAVLALLLSVSLICVWALATFWSYRAGVLSLAPNLSNHPLPISAGALLANAFALILNYRGAWANLLSELPHGGGAAWVSLFNAITLVSVLVSVLLIQLSGRIVRRTSVEGCRSWRWPSWPGVPRFRIAAFQRQRRTQLRRNPVFWLQQRTWSARSTRWGWFLAILAAELLLFRVRYPDLWLAGQEVLGLLLVIGLIYASALSYREERRNGMLEMILITPLPAWRLVTARVRSLWRQFFPAFLSWAVFACFITPTWLYTEALMRTALIMFTILLITPIVGIESDVNVRGHWRAILVTSAVVLIVPGVAFLFALSENWAGTFLCSGILWIAAIVITPGLQWQMKERRFGFLHPNRKRRNHRLVPRALEKIGPGGYAWNQRAALPRQ